jgi:DNA repair protein RadC
MELLNEETPAYKITQSTAMLADVELLALIIGGHVPSAMHKARTVLSQYGGLHNLGKAQIKDLILLGLTQRESSLLIAAFEIGRRRNMSDVVPRPKISSSRDAFCLIGPKLVDLHHEEMWLMILNKANEVVKTIRVSTGGQSGTVVDIKMMLRDALLHRAAGLIMVHNHPSGNLIPSQADIELTRKARKAGELMDLPVLDHLIVSERGYYSFADEGAI